MTDDPYRGYALVLEVDGTRAAGFVEASGLGADVDVVEFREGGSEARSSVRHLPRQARYRPLVLRYGITQDRDLWSWFGQTATGEIRRRDVALIQPDGDGLTETFRWTLRDAWPASFRAAPGGSDTGSIAIEELTLVYESLERA